MAMPRLKIGLTLIIIVGGLILGGNNSWLVAGVLAALMIHEISHILTSLLLGYQVSELKLTIFGGCMTIDPLFEANPNAEMLIAAAGPAINFIMALGVAYLDFLGFRHDYLEYWQQLNLGIGLVNLLPAYPLDGGRMIHACLTKISGLKTAARVSRGLTLGVALFFMISGSIQFFLKTGGITFLMVGAFIFVQLWYSKAPELNFWQIRRQKQKSFHQKGFLNAKLILVEPGTPLRMPLKYYGTQEYLVFFLEDGSKNFRLISEDQAWNILSKEGYQATFNPGQGFE
jgi:stage IV sporulation protein FB